MSGSADTFEIERSERIAGIAAAARELLEKEGQTGLTMRALGVSLGIKAPSLYKHVRDKDEIEALLCADALLEMGEVMRRSLARHAGRRAKTAPLEHLARAYRTWALANPELYRLATTGELPRDQLPAGLEAWSAAPLVQVAGGPDRARAAWAFAHGMTILELDGRFPPGANLTKAWAEGAGALS